MAPVAPFTHSITAPSSRYAGIVLDGRLLCAARAQQAAPVLRRQCSVTLCKAIVKEQPLPITSTVATDASVPEGHKGLHGFLYGSGGAEEHDDGEAVPSVQAPVSMRSSRAGTDMGGWTWVVGTVGFPAFVKSVRNA